FDFVAAVRGLGLLELARLDEDVAVERADRFVVRLEARLELRAERGEPRRERANSFVQQAAVLAYLARVLLHRLLLPAVRDGAQQRDQRRRAGGDDALLDSAFDERRVLLQRGAEEHFTWQEHDDELRRRRDLLEVAFGR